MNENSSAVEALFFNYLDKVKYLFFPNELIDIFLNFSKNEIFALLYIYRSSFITMSEIANYLNVPLNTATGIVARLEKKELVLRERNQYDKRVVSVSMNDKGKELIRSEIKEIEHYLNKLMGSFTEEEIGLIFDIIDKAFTILSEKDNDEDNATQQYSESRLKRVIIE